MKIYSISPTDETYMQQIKLCTGNMERVLGEKREKMGQSLFKVGRKWEKVS